MRCAVYARVSTEMDSQKTSIDNQIDIFRNYASQQNWEIVKVYTDKKSGTKNNRPGLKSLIEDGKSGLYDVILAKELSRLARNGRLSYELRDICQLNDLHIVCLDNSINSLEGNVQNFGLFAWLYENESDNSSRRNKQAKRVKAQRGLFVGSNPPYGYQCKEGKLSVRNDDTPQIVRRIFQDYLSGKGMDTIAKELTAEQCPTPSQIAGKSNASPLWHASSVKNILNNRHYCGELVQNRTETLSVTSTKRREVKSDVMTIHEDTHEAIIPKETFHTVQEMLSRRTRTATAPKKHLVTNLIFCEECGKAMWYKANQRGYRCGGNIKHGDCFCTNRLPIREGDLKEIIEEDLRELFKSFQDESFTTTLTTKLETKKQQILREISTVEQSIDQLRNKKLEYVNLYTDDLITKDDLIEFRMLIDKKVEAAKAKQIQLHESMKQCTEESYSIDLRKKLKDLLNLKELTPQLLHSLVEKIACTAEGHIRIQYTFINPIQET